MKTGKEIKNLFDIRMMIIELCTNNKKFSKNDIFVLAKQAMEGSSLIANKLLKTITDQVVDFLIQKNLLVESNGVYYQVDYALDIADKIIEKTV